MPFGTGTGPSGGGPDKNYWHADHQRFRDAQRTNEQNRKFVNLPNNTLLDPSQIPNSDDPEFVSWRPRQGGQPEVTSVPHYESMQKEPNKPSEKSCAGN